MVGPVSWTEDASLPTGTTVTVSLRTAASAAALDEASYTDFTNATSGCTKSSGTVTCASSAIPAGMKDGSGDQWLQYKVTLTSTGGNTPTFSDISIQYVVNAAPAFDATYGTNGVSVSQISDSADANFGKVSIAYKVRDTDTSTGSATPGFVTPSFQYNIGGGWVNITSEYLNSGATDNKAVDASAYTTYTAYWNAQSQISGQYLTTAQVRVSVGDNELANATTTAASAQYTLDTKAPVLSVTLNSTIASTTVAVSDDSQLQYRLCNNPSFPSSDAQGNSCAWSTLGGNIASTSASWTPRTDAESNSPVYAEAKDALGNTTSFTAVAPATPGNFDLKDISNVDISVYKGFLSWSVFSATTSSAFRSYKVYRSTDGSSYSLLSTITDSATNYYADVITTATTSQHYYKVIAENAQGNTSAYTSVLSFTPNGLGVIGTDPPVITAGTILVPTATLKNTSAVVTFSTDKLSKPTVQYRPNGSGSWSTVTGSSYSLAHSVTVQGLSPNSTYNLQVRAEDIVENRSAYSAGPNFTTEGGPIITNVTTSGLTDTAVTVTWNTSTTSDSYVYYSSNQNLTNALMRGSAVQVSCTGGVCPHSVSLSSLTPNTAYYFYVQSTDGDSNLATENNSGSYYTFTTTQDIAAPVVSNIATPVVAPNAAVITWQTNRLATSQVTWGTQTGQLTRTTVLDSTATIFHVVTLSNSTLDTAGNRQVLTAEATYFFKVHSTGSNDVATSSEEQTFTAPRTGDVIVVSTHGGGGGGSTSPTPATPATPTTPPTITLVTADSPTAFTANVKADVDREAIAIVEYGKDATYGSSAGDPRYSKSKNIKLDRLLQGTTYNYRITVIDRYGNQAVSQNLTFKTGYLSESLDNRTTLEKANDVQDKLEELIESALPSLAPPFISKPEVSSTTENSAIISWKTNVKAIGSVGYATDAQYDLVKKNDYSTEISAGTTATTTHSITLTGLSSNTRYHAQARSYVFPQVIGRSADLVFQTKAAPLVPTVVSVKKDSFTVGWKTDIPSNSIVEYRNLKTGERARFTDTAMKTFHNVLIENLPSGTSYDVYVSGLTNEGNVLDAEKVLRVMTSVDIIPPVISNFKVDNALVPGRNGFVQTVVGWQTDKPSNSIVYYEEGAGSATTSTTLAKKVEHLDSYSQSHILILPNLKSGVVYRIMAVSTDESGNSKIFGPTSIITPRQTQSVLDVIVKNFEDTFKFLKGKQE